ncbi:MAG: hypothetical protein HGB12_08050 [Bacteroidetes bacterium]|nr:hypothetical protein [Bacteroidota bacterium]
MKNQISDKKQNKACKKKYNHPEITVIKIDNDISLVMMSANPYGDPDGSLQIDHFISNPFKMPNL